MTESNNPPKAMFVLGDETREKIVWAQACPALSRFGILITGLSDARPPYQIVRDPAMHSEVQACFAGRGRVYMDNKWRDLLPGQVFLSRKGVLQAFHAAPGSRLRMAWVHYGQEPEGFLPPGQNFGLAPADPEPLRGAVSALHREVLGAAEPLFVAHIAEWIHLCVRRLIQVDTLDPRLQQLLLEVDSNLGAPWDLRTLARAANMSPEHLRRLFHKQFGQSPMQRVAHLRMNRAAFLLRSGEHKAESVAADVGYSNLYAFSTAFKRIMGAPPSTFRYPRKLGENRLSK